MRQLAILSVLFCVFVGSASAGPKDLSTMSPEKPKRGDQITITYNAAHAKARVIKTLRISLEVLVLRDGEDPLQREIAMEGKNNAWTASFTLDDAKAACLLYRFTGEGRLDDNGENVWMSMVYENEKPVRAARQRMAGVLRSGASGEFMHQRDLKSAKTLLLDELKEFPDNWKARTELWTLLSREDPSDVSKNIVKAELDVLYDQHRNDEDVVLALLPFFSRTDQQARADNIRKEWSEKKPKGKIADADARRAISREREGARRADQIEAYIEKFSPEGKALADMQNSFITAASSSLQFERAGQMVDRMQNADGSTLAGLAADMFKNDVAFSKALEYAGRAVALLREVPPSEKPSSMSNKAWSDACNLELGLALFTHAKCLEKSGAYMEAFTAYEEAYHRTMTGQPELCEAYIQCPMNGGEPDRCVEIGHRIIRDGRATDKVIEMFKKAYVPKIGPEEQANRELKDLQEESRRMRASKMLVERLDRPAPAFALKDTRGKTVKLADLKGKVVVIDFWATWCGPCKASFPTLQKVYDKYKKDDRVRFYAINTRETEKGAKREELVKKFLAEHKYTFPVLFDDNVIDAYNVPGIPTKFVIDQNGMAQFRSIGFDSAEEMESELTMQIDMILEGQTKK